MATKRSVPKKSQKTRLFRLEKQAPRRRDHYKPNLPPFEQLPDFLTMEEFIPLSRLGRTTAFEMVQSGKIPSIRLGGRKEDDGRIVGGHIRIPKTVLQLPVAAQDQAR